MNIIGLSGYISSGKDTTASVIQYLTEYPHSLNKTDYRENRSYNSFVIDVGCGATPIWEIHKFSKKLKEVASILTGVGEYGFEEQEAKKEFLPKEWEETDGRIIYPMSRRVFLQRLGTDAVRNHLHPNTWVNALFTNYSNDAKWLITDVRFPNEAKAIKERGGIVVKVNRDRWETFTDIMGVKTTVKMGPIDMHTSEIALDNWEFDYRINNNSTIENLIDRVREMLVKYEIIPVQGQEQATT